MAEAKPIAGAFRVPAPDQVLLFTSAVILAVGLVMVASASITLADKLTGNPFYFLERQLVFAVAGFVIAAAAYSIPLDLWQRTSFLILLAALAMLAIVLVPGIGRHVNGSIRWVVLGPFRVQVSEPARMLILIYIASYCMRRHTELATRFTGSLKPMLVVALAALLLLAEPDFGAAMVLIATTMAMLFFAGARLRDFAVFALLGLTGFVVLAVASPYRLERITGFLHPWSHPFDSGFQLTQSLIAIGRGGFFGVGLGESVQKLFYLPEAHTDFLFAVLAEELGLLGCMVVLTLYFIFTWRAIAIARQAARKNQMFNAYLAFGLGLWVGLQAFINMGVNMGVLPTKGLTLPLMSYGGSSLVVVCAAIGLILRVHREAREGRAWQAQQAAA
ncbi:MAG: putative lipid II flippase FtsW [Gammaproteobacteria bacterium]|nr:putative lipid II flippase FtsW [Gammaproteobacteria bacterium]MDE2345148.1 putative lipid II flippase FtsW [Gammaproteobacteria bacterium]